MIVPLASAVPFPNLNRTLRLAVLGSTGSIGRSTLELVRENPALFSVHSLVAHSSVELMVQQIREFRPRYVVLTDVRAADELRARLTEPGRSDELVVPHGVPVEQLSPHDAEALASHPDADCVVAAMVGMSGLETVLAALKAGKHVALANKESLVAGGKLVCDALKSNPAARLIPVDSEHSALFQALQGHRPEEIERLVLTASGGPFLKRAKSELSSITVQQAVNHPRWKMGQKISIDSATLVNKGLELIEAAWLFGVPAAQLSVLIHPQSIVHSLVEFCDGSQLAQLSNPDMKGPIGYALGFGRQRVARSVQSLDLAKVGTLEFLPLDSDRFPAPALAIETLSRGRAASAIYSIADEVAVGAFVKGTLGFHQIVPTIQNVLERMEGVDYKSVADLREIEREIRGFEGVPE